MASDGDTDDTLAVWALICCASISCMLFRMSIDLIQTASQKTTKDYTEDHHNATKTKTKKTSINEKDNEKTTSSKDYGSTDDSNTTDDNKDASDADAAEKSNKPDPDLVEENEALLPRRRSLSDADSDLCKTGTWSCRFQLFLLITLFFLTVFQIGNVLPEGLKWTAVTVVAFGALLTYRDKDRKRFGVVSRFFYLAASLSLAIPITVYYYRNRPHTGSGDELLVNIIGLYALLSLGESFFVPLPSGRRADVYEDADLPQKKRLSRSAILTLLKPYFWPEHTAESAAMNRIRAIVTWVCVILSKVCNLVSPALVSHSVACLVAKAKKEIHHNIWRNQLGASLT
jgi:hypothetical protein